MTSTPDASEVSRRSLVRGVALGGAALPLLAACGGTSSDSTSTPKKSSGGKPGGSGGSGGAGALATTAEVPVGGGKILTDQQVVLTQPSKGTFKAFSAICTHQGCPVGQIANGTIVCPCHGSQFSIKDGSVVGGPAPSPLPSVQISVQGTEIKRA